MKKIIALILMFMLVISGCGNAELPEENPSEAPETEDTSVSEESLALYEEMLVNFGAARSHDGSLVMARNHSLFANREGYADCANLGAEVYYSWMMSKTDNSDKIKVAIEGLESTVYAYDTAFFEERVGEFFGVSAETLQGSGLYYANSGCYFYEAASSPEMVDIDFVSAEETDGTVAITLTLTDVNGASNFVLTVKILENGGYNYVSYLPAEA